MHGAATLLWSANTAHPWWNLWLLSAGRSIYRGNIQPYCSLLYTSLPAPITTIGVRHLMICTSTSVGSRQPTQMLFLILAGDFNHADLKSVFPKIQQHVDFPTRGKNTLDFVYTTQRGAYKALPLPHLGASDHITVMLMPAHRTAR